MRIGIDMLGMQSPDHRGRGIGRYCTDLLRVLFREASSHRFVLYRHDGLPTDGLPEGTNTSIRTLPRDPGGRTSSKALARIVATNPDGLDSLLILSPFEPSADYRIPDRPAHGLPLAAVVYDLIPLLHPARYLPNERLRRRYHATTWALRRYDALLTISEWTRIDCLRLLGLPPHQVVTIGTASDPDFFTPEPTRPTPAAAREALLQLGVRPPFVLNVGGQDDRKNIWGLIDGFAGLPARLRESHQLAVACQYTPSYAAAVRDHAERRDVGGSLLLLDRVSDESLRLLYRHCAAFVFPSLCEGFGLPILEAMHCGALVIVGRNSSQPEVVGAAGLTFDAYDPSELTQRLVEVLDEPSPGERLRQASVAQAGRFRWKQTAARALRALDWVSRRSIDSKGKRDVTYIYPRRNMMRFSVVINTYNRDTSLRRTLNSFQYLNHEAFEVIVLNGPSTDDTAALLAEYQGRIKVGQCPEVNISKSRNMGIALAAGDIIAFIDDDAVPEPDWLDDLEAEYNDSIVGAVGGRSILPNGRDYQCLFATCDRLGNNAVVDLDQVPIPLASQMPGADPFLTMMGVNSSFRRRVLVEVGGFDEEYEYYLDETDVCARVNDLGYAIRFSERGVVHHYLLPSHIRDAQLQIRNLYPYIKNKTYFAWKFGRIYYSDSQIDKDNRAWADRWLENEMLKNPTLGEAGQRELRQGVEMALVDGRLRGRSATSRVAGIGNPAADFLPFPRLRPAGKKLILGFVSQGYPPQEPAGIARYTHALAEGLAARGHEVHVFTRHEQNPQTSFEGNVWVHRSPEANERGLHAIEEGPIRRACGRMAAVHQDIQRVGDRSPFDLIQTPNWDSEGLMVACDDSYRTIVSLQTTAKIMQKVNPEIWNTRAVDLQIALEKTHLRQARDIHALSSSVREHAIADYGVNPEQVRIHVIPLGLPDRGHQHRRVRADDKVRILFVGRLEPRKGIDLLLAAMPSLLARFPNLEFRIVGEDLGGDSLGSSYAALFRHECPPEHLDRCQFLGKVSEPVLYHEYANADVFCAPSRYESFGLILVEAMMFSLPCIGGRTGGMSEVLRDGLDGFLVGTDDHAELAERLATLASDPALRQRMGDVARSRYEAEFVQEAMVQRLEHLYQQFAA